jgi:hypothetical protein
VSNLAILPRALSKSQEDVKSDTKVNSKWLLRDTKDSSNNFGS